MLRCYGKGPPADSLADAALCSCAKQARSVGVDSTKLLFAFFIILAHMDPSVSASSTSFLQSFAYRVPFFITLALYYFIQKLTKVIQQRQNPLLKLQLDRLWVPYVSWTLIYVVARVCKHRLEGAALSWDLGGVTFYGEAALHLYFLPFLMLCYVWTMGLLLLLSRCRIRLSLCLLLAGFAYGHFGTHHGFFGFERAFEGSWLYVASALLLHAMRSTVRWRLPNTCASALIGVGIVGASVSGHSLAYLGQAAGPVVGFAIASLCLSMPHAHVSSPFLRYVLGCSFGIYLIHHLLIEGIEVAATQVGLPLAPYSLTTKLGVAVFVCACSIALIAAIRTNRHLKYLLLGDRRSPKFRPLPMALEGSLVGMVTAGENSYSAAPVGRGAPGTAFSNR